MHAAKRRGKTRSRILYWFRTPPSVRVGRAALDEEAIRLIEEHNPDVEFDWTRILKEQNAPEARPRSEPERRPARPERSREPGPARPRAAAPRAVAEPPPLEPDSEQALGSSLTLAPDEPASAALARLGPEGLLRLRARHAEVLARISEKIAEPARRAELKTQADRLNPDTWVTDGDVTSGLEQYESVFESLRSVVGHRRTRRKRRARGGDASPPPAPAAEVDPTAEASKEGLGDGADEPGDPDGNL